MSSAPGYFGYIAKRIDIVATNNTDKYARLRFSPNVKAIDAIPAVKSNLPRSYRTERAVIHQVPSVPFFARLVNVDDDIAVGLADNIERLMFVRSHHVYFARQEAIQFQGGRHEVVAT